MRKVIITLMISFLFLSGVQAQSKQAQKRIVPGYMGLKLSLQYQGGISPQWNNLNYSFLPYLSHNVQLGYVVSRKHEVGLQYTRIDYSSRIGSNIYDFNTQSLVATDFRAFTGNNVMAYVKFFRERKGFIAPLGRYYLLGLSYQNSRDKYHVTADGNSIVGVPNTTYVQSHDIAITVGVGRNIIIANRMLLTIEGDINIPFSAGIRAARSNSDVSGLGSLIGDTNPYKRFNSIDVMLVNLIQIKIGLGALVF